MTFEVQQTRWDRIVRRVSGSIGPGSRVSETLSELFPVLDVERVPGELLLLGGTRLAWGGHSVTGSAGNAAKVQLFNPLGSGNIITVTAVFARLESAGTLRMATEPSARTTDAGTATFRDTRLGVGGQPVGQIRQENTATIISVVNVYFVLLNETMIFKDENSIAVLGPGTGLTVGPAANDQNTTVEFWWRERPAEESELSL